LHNHLNNGLNKLMNMAGPVKKEQPLMLGQVSSSQHTEEKVDVKSEQSTKETKPKRDSGVLSTKHFNTKGTMLLYFCIMSVLLIFCLGRCLVVPLSQASRFELNQRKHVKKLDKNGFIQQEVIS